MLKVLIFLLVPCFSFASDLAGVHVFRDRLGVNIHFLSGHQKDLEAISIAGFGFVRMDLRWDRIEKSKGVYDWSAYDAFISELEQYQLKPLFILDYSNSIYEPVDAKTGRTFPPISNNGLLAFSQWAKLAAARYKNRGVVWEIWNEPNHPYTWLPKPSASEYSVLVRSVKAALVDGDNNAFVVGPAMAGVDWPYLENMLVEVGNSFDAITIHPYRGVSQPPETVINDYQMARLLLRKHLNIGKAGGLPQVWSGEWGYPTHSNGVTFEVQANYLERMFLVNLLQEIPLSIWYDWMDDGSDKDNKEHNFGLIKNDGVAKPSYLGMTMLSGFLKDAHYIRRFSVADPAINLVEVYEGNAVSKKYISWRQAGESELHVSAKCATVEIISRDQQPRTVPCDERGFSLTINEKPTYVTLK